MSSPCERCGSVGCSFGCMKEQHDEIRAQYGGWLVELGLVLGVGAIGAVSGLVLDGVRFAVFGGAVAVTVAGFEWWRRTCSKST